MKSINIWWNAFVKQFQGISWIQLAICAILIFLVLAVVKKTHKNVMYKDLIVWLVFLVFSVFIIQITLLNREADSRSIVETKIHLGLFLEKGGTFQQTFYAGLNYILFVPWGCALGLIRKREAPVKRCIMILLLSFIACFTIECIQMVTGRGNFEVTDILMNSAGGLSGSILACLFHKILIKHKGKEESEKGISTI